jgi:hypothetical protein
MLFGVTVIAESTGAFFVVQSFLTLTLWKTGQDARLVRIDRKPGDP